ncbi:MAG: selenide, water dikinase SelD, partial [Flavobacteriales bacterium]
VLLLTKPLGIGVLSTAQKRGKLHEEHKHIGRDLMLKPNSIGTVLGTMEGVHALTDVTGFGLLGHLMEMCLGSDLSARLQYADIPLISESVDYVKGGCYADGALRNWKSVAAHVEGANSMERMMLLCDPQTSGGLLIACDPALLPQLEELFTSAGEQFKCIGKLHGDTNNKRIIVG